MEEIIENFTEAVSEGSASAQEFTAEEMESQTTDFLLAFIDQLTDMNEEQKAKLRNNVIERALHPELFTEEAFAKKHTSQISPQDLVILIAFAVLILTAFGKSCLFHYQL